MTQSIRQNNLFVAEDWTAVYESYVNANFQAYDFETIRQSMIDYVRAHYPENYNDWVESSEFVALLDLIAQFGHNLAFRIDLNSRNNFLSTAERQDAVFKLAEFLGYQPRRNIPATGMLKIVSVKTNETVLGSQGSSLGGQEIRYENSSNVDNLDDFITVMNAIMSSSNQFGSPRKQAVINGVSTQFYNLSNAVDQIVFNVTGAVSGSSAAFNTIGVDYDSTSRTIIESTPDPIKAFSIAYKNDGQGIGSKNTGFFVGIKQGALSSQDFLIQEPVSNMSLDVDVDNINESDVWVQTVESDGTVIKNWTKVSTTTGYNTNYTGMTNGDRNVYSVKTRTNNQISIQFADAAFGNLPSGIIRVWYRSSVNDTYVVRPDDIGSKKISVSYRGADNNIYTATLSVQLQIAITNASASETLDEIKQNAPRVYATQDRMITANDYNAYLARQSNNILKLKSINRTHSGHSRYFDYVDPTGTYDNVDVFGTDGKLTRTEAVTLNIIGELTGARIVSEHIAPILNTSELLNLYYEQYQEYFNYNKQVSLGQVITLQTTGTQGSVTSGYFTDVAGSVLAVGNTSNTYLRFATIGALVKMIHPITGEQTWTKVSHIANNGLGLDNALGVPTGRTLAGIGALSFDASIPDGSVVDKIYPAFSRRMSTTVRAELISQLNARQDVLMRYDYRTGDWVISTDTTSINSYDLDGSIGFPSFDFTNDSWMIYVDCSTSSNEIKIYNRSVKYNFNSVKTVFSSINGDYLLDAETNKRRRDTIRVYTGNNSDNVQLYVSRYDTDGSLVLVLEDKNNDGRPDNPDALFEIINALSSSNNLRFEWNHVPSENELIDPSFTNIIDVFALTSTYDSEYRRYLADTSNNIQEPRSPTIDELNQQFSQVNNKKAMSDKIVYRPVKYKPIFGDKAEPYLQGRIRVVKVPTSVVTDNEIKNKIVDAVAEFFSLQNWDFGETFYFTELAAYVHQTMPGIISSLVIVPEGSSSAFGDLFQITPNTDELFIPDFDINNIDIIDSINSVTIRN